VNASTHETDTAILARRRFISALRWTAILGAADVLVWASAALAWFDGHSTFAALFAYPAASLLVVAFLYVGAGAGANPGPYLKGERTPWLQPVFLPYRAVAYTLTVLARVARLHSVSRVTDQLFVGARLMPADASRLESLGVGYVVDLCAECPTNRRLARAPFERLGVPVLDRCPPTIDEVDRTVDWIAARIAGGGRVYVHCAFGRGRSAMVTAAALVRIGAARDSEEAIATIRRARPSIRLNAGQRAVLDAWVARRRTN
jgi:hypothetical protein